MSKTLEIYFSDLNNDAKADVLKFYNISSAREGNLNLIPLFILEYEESEEEKSDE